MWTVYDRPLDYPDKVVARRWEVGPGGSVTATPDVLGAETLDDIRRFFEDRGLYCLTRQPGDDPAIVETWL